MNLLPTVWTPKLPMGHVCTSKTKKNVAPNGQDCCGPCTSTFTHSDTSMGSVVLLKDTLAWRSWGLNLTLQLLQTPQLDVGFVFLLFGAVYLLNRRSLELFFAKKQTKTAAINYVMRAGSVNQTKERIWIGKTKQDKFKAELQRLVITICGFITTVPVTPLVLQIFSWSTFIVTILIIDAVNNTVRQRLYYLRVQIRAQKYV